MEIGSFWFATKTTDFYIQIIQKARYSHFYFWDKSEVVRQNHIISISVFRVWQVQKERCFKLGNSAESWVTRDYPTWSMPSPYVHAILHIGQLWAGVNILPKIKYFSPMLPCLDQNLPPIFPIFVHSYYNCIVGWKGTQI